MKLERAKGEKFRINETIFFMKHIMNLGDSLLWDMEVPDHATTKDSLSAWIVEFHHDIGEDKWSIRNKSIAGPEHQPTSDREVGRKLSCGNSRMALPRNSLARVLLWLLLSRPRSCSDPARQWQLFHPMGRYKPFHATPGPSKILSKPTGKPYPSSGEVLTASAKHSPVARQGWAMLKPLPVS